MNVKRSTDHFTWDMHTGRRDWIQAAFGFNELASALLASRRSLPRLSGRFSCA